MTKSRIILITLLIAASSVACFAQSNTPVAAVSSFYKFDRSHSQILNRRNLDARRKWLSDSLYKLFLIELKRERAFLKQNPTNKPHFGDGLPFQPIQESCGTGGKEVGRRLGIKPAFQKGNRAAASVTFAYPKPCKDPDAITYTIGLIKGKTGWLIDDVNYGDVSSLKADLRRKEY